MDHTAHNKLISFIWSIAVDCLRDVCVRGKYRDGILPMVVLRRLDTLLEPSKGAVMEEVTFQIEEIKATELDKEPLKAASGYVFFNTSKWTLNSLHNTATNNQQILLANFEEYLNGSSLFTGDAGDGESNICRYIIENDMLEAIVQLLNNKKADDRLGKVQLIGASLLFRKLGKNLGNKNSEFSPEHIVEITQTYLNCSAIERKLDANDDAIGIASQVFNNEDFGCYKVNIQRPDRRKAQFTKAAIAPLRFDKALRETMEYIYSEYGDKVYEKGFLKTINKSVISWCEENDISLNAKAKTKLLDEKQWLKLQETLQATTLLMAEIGETEFNDFNFFKEKVDGVLKEKKVKLASAQKNTILNTVSWYDENAVKVIKTGVKISKDKLAILLENLGCTEKQLPDFGYYPLNKEGGKLGEYITDESCTDLRDAESVPLSDEIHRYFLAEVKPHIAEAPDKEQTAIANFLDKKTTLMNSAVTGKIKVA